MSIEYLIKNSSITFSIPLQINGDFPQKLTILNEFKQF